MTTNNKKKKPQATTIDRSNLATKCKAKPQSNQKINKIKSI